MNSVDAPVDTSRRRFFNRLAKAGDSTKAIQSPAWHRVPGLGAIDGDVLWSGWASNNEIFVIGDGGTVLHFDGSTNVKGGLWHSMETPTRLPLHAIWGKDRNELFAVGWMGAILRFDGSHWFHECGGVVNKETKSFTACTENTPLFAITGNDKGHAWAVGDDGMILSFDGDSWQPQASPTQSNLRGITCTPSGQLFAVGGEGTVITSSGDGSWELMDCPYNAGFTTILALSDDELLMAGGRYFVDAGGFRGELIRYRAGQFTPLHADKPMPRLRAVQAHKQGVLIAGDSGHLYSLEGNSLNELRSDNRHDLMDIVPLPTGEAIAVGDFSTIMTANPDFLKALAPDEANSAQDEDWEVLEAVTKHNLWGLYVAPDDTLYACGDGGTVLQQRDEQWHTMDFPGTASLHCMWDSGDGRLYAAGESGQIFCYDGSTWTLSFDLYLDITILALWGSRPDSIYAAGDDGLILHWNGELWKRMISGTKSALYNIWGMDDEHILVVGDFGLILRWNGKNWTEFYAGTDHFLFDIWGDALDNIFVVALSGTLAHFDGGRWSLTSIRAREDLTAIDGLPGHGPFAVGNQGTILHYKNNEWQAECSPTSAGLRAICVCPDGAVYAAGNHGTIIKRRLTCEGIQQ